jgi:dCMP deaminase
MTEISAENLNIKKVDGDIHKKFLRLAYQQAWNNSDDPLTKTGAVLVKDGEVIAQAENHFPKGIKYPEKFNGDNDPKERTWILKHIVHAEPAVVHAAAKKGVSTEGTTIYMPWIPCTQCALVIIDAGIKKLIGHKQMIMKTPPYWYETCCAAIDILKKGGVELLIYDGKIGDCKALMEEHGEWEP